jgi:hypothetical protein
VAAARLVRVWYGCRPRYSDHLAPTLPKATYYRRVSKQKNNLYVTRQKQYKMTVITASCTVQMEFGSMSIDRIIFGLCTGIQGYFRRGYSPSERNNAMCGVRTNLILGFKSLSFMNNIKHFPVIRTRSIITLISNFWLDRTKPSSFQGLSARSARFQF